MLKTILIIVILTSALVIIGTLIPQQLTTNINNAFVYFLSQINNLNAFSPQITGALITSIQIFGNFLFALSGYFMVRFVLNLIA